VNDENVYNILIDRVDEYLLIDYYTPNTAHYYVLDDSYISHRIRSYTLYNILYTCCAIGLYVALFSTYLTHTLRIITQRTCSRIVKVNYWPSNNLIETRYFDPV